MKYTVKNIENIKILTQKVLFVIFETNEPVHFLGRRHL